MPGELWPWMNSRSPPWLSVGACQKWPKPMSYNVASELRRFLVGAQNDGQRVPANDGAQPVFDGTVAGRLLLLFRRNGVLVSGRQRSWHIDAFAPRLIDKPVDEEVGSCRAPVHHDGVERVQPFCGLGGVDVVLRAHLVLLVARGFGHGAPDPRSRLVIIARERTFNSRKTQ